MRDLVLLGAVAGSGGLWALVTFCRASRERRRRPGSLEELAALLERARRTQQAAGIATPGQPGRPAR